MTRRDLPLLATVDAPAAVSVARLSTLTELGALALRAAAAGVGLSVLAVLCGGAIAAALLGPVVWMVE